MAVGCSKVCSSFDAVKSNLATIAIALVPKEDLLWPFPQRPVVESSQQARNQPA